MPDSDLEQLKVVSTRIESFDKMLLDVRLKILGYSAIAAGVVEVFAATQGSDALSDTAVALLLSFIALAIAAVAIVDATYYNQLLIAAVMVAIDHEKKTPGAVPSLHTTVGELVDEVPWWLYSLAYGAPALFLVLLAFRHDQGIGLTGLVVYAVLAYVVASYLGDAESRLGPVKSAPKSA